MVEKNNGATVRSLGRGLQILECFKKNSSLTLTEISEQTYLSVSTCDRLLKTLVETGFIEKNFKKQYTLGDKMYDFLNILSHRSNLTELAFPSLTLLRDTYNETASLYIEQNINRVCISSVESTYALRRTVNVGEILPLSQGAVGAVFLANMTEKERNGLISTIPFELENELEDIKTIGYAENDSLQEEGVYAIAAPIFDSNNNTIGVISVSGPSYRIREKRVNIIKALIFHSNSISVKLGYKI